MQIERDDQTTVSDFFNCFWKLGEIIIKQIIVKNPPMPSLHFQNPVYSASLPFYCSALNINNNVNCKEAIQITDIHWLSKSQVPNGFCCPVMINGYSKADREHSHFSGAARDLVTYRWNEPWKGPWLSGPRTKKRTLIVLRPLYLQKVLLSRAGRVRELN